MIVLALFFNKKDPSDSDPGAEIEKLREMVRELEIEKQRLQEKLEEEQAKQANTNRVLTTTSLHISQKNQVLADLQDKLGSLAQQNDKLKPEIKKIQKSIQNNIDLDDDWDNFKMHFEKVHPDFFDKLQAKFSTLTANDLKYCAYVKMNLSTKEVTRLLNISVQGVKMLRYRLKKKMDLDKELNLTDFILSI